jgi:EAL domain-containing protein (putative c-di-GMP-specific phosphodiesterase class I)/GGDEF domain-containing protein/CBS domain-containing protein
MLDSGHLSDSSQLVSEAIVLGPQRITPVFQPIVDLLTGAPLGYEVLARAESSGESAEPLFAEARLRNTTWELERACRQVALERIGALGSVYRNALFFLNVSPSVLEDSRFIEDFTTRELRRRGIEPASIVLEVTEKQSISHHERFSEIVRHYTSQGLQFAVDDFGSGHSSLLALVSCAPRFIKLDGAVVHDLHLHSYQRHLVRSLSTFAASVDSRLIAEGVESWEELEALLRLGVRYAQGYLLARPLTDPHPIAEVTASRLRQTLRNAEASFGQPEEFIKSLVEPVETLPLGSSNVEELHTMFRDRSTLEHLVVVKADKPCGLVTRQDLSAKLAGRYAYALRQKKPVERVAKTTPLIVSSDAKVTTLAAHAMERAPADLYDPVIIVDDAGALVGTVTIRSLIQRSIELQVRSAQGESPLTGLPGSRSIHQWIDAFRTAPELVVLYVDLDRFKEYNDRYGFLMGDEMIRLSARVLSRMAASSDTARVGHVGGDDFVIIFPNGVSTDPVETACREFDEEKLALLDPEDVRAGHIVAKSRTGQVEPVPLVTMSIAMIERSKLRCELHPALLSHLSASLKALAKRKTAEERRSGYIAERRAYP